jgi:hypothetical protein
MQTLAKDFTVKLQNDRPGALAQAFEAIAKAGINVEGFSETEGTVHLLTTDAASTRKALETAGLNVSREEDAVVTEVVDRPGVAANIFRQIADGNVNVSFSYVATNNRLVIGASNLGRLQEILSKQTTAIS